MNKKIDLIINELSSKKAENVLVVNFESNQASVADQFIIASALNNIHLNSLVGAIKRFYKNNKDHDLAELDYFGTSGTPESGWVILDFNDVVLHIMDHEVRELYDFDNLFEGYENYRYH